MAKTTPDTTQPNGTTVPTTDAANGGSKELAGGPEPAKTTAGAPAVPTGSGEPAKQAVSGAASGVVTPPSRAEYEMPDDYANESPVAKVKQWAETNPGLALLAASGVGLVVGRLLMALSPDPEPPSLTSRVEKRAKQLKKEAGHSLDDAKHNAGEAATASAAAIAAAAVALKEAAEKLGDRASHIAEDGADKAKDLADMISDVAKVAVTGVVAKKADSWIKKFRS